MKVQKTRMTEDDALKQLKLFLFVSHFGFEMSGSSNKRGTATRVKHDQQQDLVKPLGLGHFEHEAENWMLPI